ncbi:glycoside hydrolase family 3 N-terminal domain-containing protein [Saccharibacillus sp. CPCC 101409]|uniref:glycoside hydrolase family 3 N-terminal domain-containing protein n=1 Tax=Saccharibacillus sp. CPCC 101409 TaxID=3058041 RepID=UPI002673DB62|nr:glycoside hydrolase family 3 N-terminal domain-containing protein [Saccharibacillus sp. CPCC 101409]MDO3408668.1 glycoside hydrolase family 3 N-terminal domain-containing protein [Saccharibacillus sp. CPCC 101409]
MDNQQLLDLIDRMTLEEKIAQLLQLAAPFYEGVEDEGQITGPMQAMGITDPMIASSGSILGYARAAGAVRVQEAHLKKNPHGIPLLFMADIVHGFKTIFPVPLAMGCSWDMELAERSAEIAAREAAVSGVHVTFAPMVDLVRDPRWGRVMESTGEDPYLNSLFAKAFVRGLQGDNLKEETERVAACVKHFAAYGASEAGRDYNTVDLSERQLREYYLPAYKAALDEGCEMVMTSFNTIDGIPASGNEKLMRGLLREEWGFDGVLISDWGAVKELIPHGAAEDEREAAYRAIRAGVDIEMMTSCYVHGLPELVREGRVDEALIDESVLRILQLKEKLGLFDNPTRGASPERAAEVIFSREHRDAAYEAAIKSIVLLKNEGGVLPLSPEAKVALIGPFASSGDILGPWSWDGSTEDAVKLDAALSERLGKDRLIVAEGCGIERGTDEHLLAALKAAAEADVIVLALGEASEMSGEAGSRSDIRLPQAQLELIDSIAGLRKPTAAVLFNGRPLDLHGVYDKTGAVVEAWFPGSEGGAAVADILLGAVDPSARLTMSFPHSVGQVPVYYNHFNTGRPLGAADAQVRYVSQYLDAPNDPLLPFGFGLSYTTFGYDGLKLSSDEMTADRPITVSVNVTNTGARAGTETVQLYVRDIAGEVVRPVRELKGFVKLELAPGERGTAVFTLGEEQLRYHHSDLSFGSDPGRFEVFVGRSSLDTLKSSFILKEN